MFKKRVSFYSLIDGMGEVDIQAVLELATPREEKVLRMHYGVLGDKKHSLRKIGQVFGGLTGETIRQIELKGLRRIRECLQLKYLAEYIRRY